MASDSESSAPPIDDVPVAGEQTALLSATKPGDAHTPHRSAAPRETGGRWAVGIPRSPPPHNQHLLPQAIAHRGYKVAAPENSLLAFSLAVDDARAHAVETDLHLSRDGVVVLSHDATLKRCYGRDEKVCDLDWEGGLSELRTTRKVEGKGEGEPMARLVDLLVLLNEGGREGVWVMLDVKRDNDPTEIMRRTAETIASVPGVRPWNERIMICCWSAQFIKAAQTHLPAYPLANVGVSTFYTRALSSHLPHLSLSMLRFPLAMPLLGRIFIRDMRRKGHPIHAWTINDEGWMRWCVRMRFDGVITDDPKTFLAVCAEMGGDGDDDEAKRQKEERERKAGRGGGGGGGERGGIRGLITSPVTSARRRAKACVEWALHLVIIATIMVVYFYRWGFPGRSVRKTLEG